MADLEVLRDAAVLIEGSRFSWVGPRSDAPKAGANVVEVSGRVIPGFRRLPHACGVRRSATGRSGARALGVDYKAIAAAAAQFCSRCAMCAAVPKTSSKR